MGRAGLAVDLDARASRHPEVSTFKVAGKIFALTTLDARPLTVNLKCDPAEAGRLREGHPELIVPGWHMNKRHWNTVTVDGALPACRWRPRTPTASASACAPSNCPKAELHSEVRVERMEFEKVMGRASMYLIATWLLDGGAG
ncbi:MmcQ/YjbR family DNA-binding protein [Streptomyces sp. 110]|uniref:MmcQ/YjbR family DNA-binding protein n=1 Tax=Streptomyces endocoffeicus TaxID=2898945 RepID=A0ABS1Q4W7_9ACTN|nr:MmcQ/YjbR family DNA-binding protein [Streptomyces endocoffeicus]